MELFFVVSALVGFVGATVMTLVIVALKHRSRTAWRAEERLAAEERMWVWLRRMWWIFGSLLLIILFLAFILM